MTEDSQDELARAYAILNSLRDNISQITEYRVEEKYVNEFHTVLDKLESVGIETTEFRVPDSLVKPRLRVSSRSGDVYSKEKYVERSFILIKIDAVLGYFKIITSEKPKKIGFSTSQD
jgi:hypothetical protein